ncbi:uncharacterized protein LOC114717694 [Neltuma alba]|uniref:uncharacterized protein LOC114717694 n=1 Tax=Neltuma alba TaxID=207710 RepID=UPI0010A4E4C4|nr:uncharacterized protein LOC114717694 [Prosopis alba]
MFFLNKQDIVQITLLRSQMKKVLSLIFLMWMALLVLADLSMATSENVNNSFIISTYRRGSADCLIGDDNIEGVNGLLMNSHGGRMLLDTPKLKTPDTGSKNEPAVPCPLNTRCTDQNVYWNVQNVSWRHV